MNPNIHEDVCGSWKHAAVVNTLLAQGEGKAATRYLHTKGVLGATPQEQQLYLSVLLNNRFVITFSYFTLLFTLFSFSFGFMLRGLEIELESITREMLKIFLEMTVDSDEIIENFQFSVYKIILA